MSNCPYTAIGNGVRSRPDFVDGLADREIAERLYLSRHTVSQYVKRIYRKLAVDSRVARTRLLLGRRKSDQSL